MTPSRPDRAVVLPPPECPTRATTPRWAVPPTRAAQGSEPGFELSVKEGTSNQLMDELSQGKLDFAVLRSANLPAGDEHLQLERLYDDKIVIICSSAQKAPAGNAVVPLRSLLKEGWVLPEAADRWADDSLARYQRCGMTTTLQAHHLKYSPRGIEHTPDSDCVTLCKRHHDYLEALK